MGADDLALVRSLGQRVLGEDLVLVADNQLVLGLPKEQQQKALRYGIFGAFGFRALATLLAVYLIRLGWVKLAGAGYLMYLTIQHFSRSGDAGQRRTPHRGSS